MLLYGCETCCVTNQVCNTLSSFHHQVTLWCSGFMPCYLPREDQWV
jgi:hypothetical protein